MNLVDLLCSVQRLYLPTRGLFKHHTWTASTHEQLLRQQFGYTRDTYENPTRTHESS